MMTNTLPRRRTTWAPGLALRDRSDWRTFMAGSSPHARVLHRPCGCAHDNRGGGPAIPVGGGYRCSRCRQSAGTRPAAPGGGWSRVWCGSGGPGRGRSRRAARPGGSRTRVAPEPGLARLVAAEDDAQVAVAGDEQPAGALGVLPPASLFGFDYLAVEQAQIYGGWSRHWAAEWLWFLS